MCPKYCSCNIASTSMGLDPSHKYRTCWNTEPEKKFKYPALNAHTSKPNTLLSYSHELQNFSDMFCFCQSHFIPSIPSSFSSNWNSIPITHLSTMMLVLLSQQTIIFSYIKSINFKCISQPRKNNVAISWVWVRLLKFSGSQIYDLKPGSMSCLPKIAEEIFVTPCCLLIRHCFHCYSHLCSHHCPQGH